LKGRLILPILKADAVGEVRARLLLENQRDRILADAGHLDAAQVRRAELDALVDTGAVMTLLPQDAVEALGLLLDGKIIVTLVNEEKIELPRARLLSLTLAGRQTDTDCLVGPPECEPLLGQLVLERLDLIVDPVKCEVTPRPESPFLPSLKLK
jgi:predicted aspartyl protease